MNLHADQKKYALQIILLTLATITVFSNILSNQFVWDDNNLIRENPYVKNLGSVPYLFTPHYWNYAHPGSKGGYRPIFMASLAVDYYLWKVDVFGFHLTSISLHLMNVFLIFILVTLLTKGARSGPWFFEAPFIAALLFAVHPVHVESVTWIKNRGDPLSSIFFITAFILFIKSVSGEWSRTKAALTGSVFCFVVSLLSKEIAITLPLVLISYCFYALPSSDRIKAAFKTLPFFCVCALYAVLKLGLFTTENLSKGVQKIGIYSNALVVLKTFAYYIGIMANPLNLNAERRLSVPVSFFEPPVLLSLTLLAAVITVIVIVRKRGMPLGFSLLWIIITLLPASNIVSLYPRPIAEQRLYLPSIGFCLALALIFSRSFGSPEMPVSRKFKTLSVAALIFLTTFYSFLTLRRNLDWRDASTFWTKTSMSAPYRSRTHYNLGCIFLNEGKLPEAIDSFKKAIYINRTHIDAYCNLGNAYYMAGLYDEAIACLEKAVEIDPCNLRARADLNVLYQVTGRTDEAVKFYRRMLELYPDDGSVCNNLAVAYEENMGRHEDAIELYKRAMRLGFKDPVVYYNMGVAYDSLNMPKEAMESYGNAIRLNPDFSDAYNNIAAIYKRQGKNELAIRYDAKAKRLKEPNKSPVVNKKS
jgi:tetratricopeptide (TPR) repeat protein